MEPWQISITEYAGSSVHVVADVLVGIVLLVVAVAISARVRMRPATALAGPARALVAFFAFCGAAYVIAGLTLWLPLRGPLDVVQAATAAITVVTVLIFAVTTRQFSNAEKARLQAQIDDLHEQVSATQQKSLTLLGESSDLKSKLDASALELETSSQSFKHALLGSGISLLRQNLNLEYTGVMNPPTALKTENFVGLRDEDIFPAEVAAELTAAKARAIEGAETQTVSFELKEDGQTRFYDLKVHLLYDPLGEPVALSSVAIDVTEHRMHMEQLRVLLRELTHRSKNLLAIIIGISNMTSKLTRDPREFHKRFSDRLRSLSDAHDALAEEDWVGADLAKVVAKQIAPYQDTHSEAIKVEGDSVWLKPNAVQYLTLALQELAANAAQHGAIHGNGGSILLSWTHEDPESGEGGLDLVWKETFGTEIKPGLDRGFGREILEKIVPSALQGTSSLDLTDTDLTYVLKVAPVELGYPR